MPQDINQWVREQKSKKFSNYQIYSQLLYSGYSSESAKKILALSEINLLNLIRPNLTKLIITILSALLLISGLYFNILISTELGNSLCNYYKSYDVFNLDKNQAITKLNEIKEIDPGIYGNYKYSYFPELIADLNPYYPKSCEKLFYESKNSRCFYSIDRNNYECIKDKYSLSLHVPVKRDVPPYAILSNKNMLINISIVSLIIYLLSGIFLILINLFMLVGNLARNFSILFFFIIGFFIPYEILSYSSFFISLLILAKTYFFRFEKYIIYSSLILGILMVTFVGSSNMANEDHKINYLGIDCSKLIDKPIMSNQIEKNDKSFDKVCDTSCFKLCIQKCNIMDIYQLNSNSCICGCSEK